MNALTELKIAEDPPRQIAQPRRGPAKLVFKETGKVEVGLKLPPGFGSHRFKKRD